MATLQVFKLFTPYSLSIYVEDEKKKAEKLRDLERDLKSFEDAIDTQEEYIDELMRDET